MNRSKIEDVVARLKAQHPAVCVGTVPVQFSPDQVRKMLIEVGKEQPKFRVEYDDGRTSKSDKDKSPFCTRKDRQMGFYLILPDGDERPLNIGYMRVSEMAGLERLFNDVVR